MLSTFTRRCALAALSLGLVQSLLSFGAGLPAGTAQRLQSGQAVELIVEYEASAIEQEAAVMRSRTARRLDDARVLAYRAERYKALKSGVDAAMLRPGIEHLADYSHLPMAFKRFRTRAVLDEFLAHPGVKAVYENDRLHRVLVQSLPLIGQPEVAAAGENGAGATVAVIDDGIDYGRAAFGSCTAPGAPAGCKVVASLNFGTGTTDNSHGTNVSAIVLGVAPESRIAMLNAFSGSSAYSADIIGAMNWTIANQAAYNIAAINMSLGDGNKFTAPCSGGNVFSTPVANARNAGITVVAAAGNEAYTNGIGKPACTPGAISVGATYDANVGGLAWGSNLCTDSTTAADKVACFSDSASFLTMLAPGALTTAGGYTMGGTSQASPHVAGAVAVLRSAFPAETLDQTQVRMMGSGTPVTDPRNGIVKPRLNLLAAAKPANDAFAGRFPLNGAAGSAGGTNQLATKEGSEANHAGNPGGHSVWWKWTAPAAGQVSVDTHGSRFDTLLAVYSGSGMGALVQIAANNDDGSAGGASGVLFQAQFGMEYEIAVDGADGAAGSAVLNWSLNTSAQANISVGISGPSGVTAGSAASYTITVSNAGPQAATGVRVSIVLPSGASYLPGLAVCSAGGGTVTCEVGTLASGEVAALAIQVMWDTVGGPATLSASAASDLPDPSMADNRVAFQTFQTTDGDGDVPTLPEWGVLLLATLLMGSVAGRRR